MHDLRTLHRFEAFRDSETRETRTLSAAGRGAIVDTLQETMRFSLDHLNKRLDLKEWKGTSKHVLGPKLTDMIALFPIFFIISGDFSTMFFGKEQMSH